MECLHEWTSEWAEARSASRSENEGNFVSEARSRRVGGTTQSELMSVVIKRPHRRSKLRILGCGGREKERAPILWIGWRGRTGGGMKERDGHVLLNLFARKLHSRLCSCLASA